MSSITDAQHLIQHIFIHIYLKLLPVSRTGKCMTTWSTSCQAKMLPRWSPVRTSQRWCTGERWLPTSIYAHFVYQSHMSDICFYFPNLHSKPITPTTHSNKALPFIKVIEIKSWTEPRLKERPEAKHTVYIYWNIYQYIDCRDCLKGWFYKASWWQSKLLFLFVPNNLLRSFTAASKTNIKSKLASGSKQEATQRVFLNLTVRFLQQEWMSLLKSF